MLPYKYESIATILVYLYFVIICGASFQLLSYREAQLVSAYSQINPASSVAFTLLALKAQPNRT